MASPGKTKKVGILGGKGPDATVGLFNKIVENSSVRCEEEHLRIFIDNHPQTPKPSLAIVGQGDDPVPAMLESLRILEAAGADFIALPCNSAHYFLPDLEAKAKIPLLNIISETVNYAHERSIKCIGLLASSGLMESGLYQQKLAEKGIELCPNTAEEQEALMHGILTFKDTGDPEELRLCLDNLIARLTDADAQAVILGCTELPLLANREKAKIELLDTLDILARACIREAHR